MNIERWMPVKGFEGIYEVSDIGRIRQGFKGSEKKKVTTFVEKQGYVIALLGNHMGENQSLSGCATNKQLTFYAFGKKNTTRILMEPILVPC